MALHAILRPYLTCDIMSFLHAVARPTAVLALAGLSYLAAQGTGLRLFSILRIFCWRCWRFR